MKNYRHGDLALIGIKKLPATGVKKADTNVLMTGSGGNDHVFSGGGAFFHSERRDGFLLGYLVATDDTLLLHPDHGISVDGGNLREARIEAGVYELRKQQEDTHSGMKPVVD